VNIERVKMLRGIDQRTARRWLYADERPGISFEHCGMGGEYTSLHPQIDAVPEQCISG